jgi:uncharacterized protein (DUF2237 family)
MFVNIFERQFTPLYQGIGDICIRVTHGFASMYPEYKVGDTVYVPVSMWVDANERGKAPQVLPHQTHLSVLSHVPLNILSRYFLIK